MLVVIKSNRLEWINKSAERPLHLDVVQGKTAERNELYMQSSERALQGFDDVMHQKQPRHWGFCPQTGGCDA